MRLQNLIQGILMCLTVSAIDGSIFQSRQFNQISQQLVQQNEICIAPDSTYASIICSQNGNQYQYNCIQDPSFIACFGINGTSSDGVTSFLNLSTKVKNITYVGRNDFDLSNCSINQETFTISCNYYISGYGAPINTTNTTVQQRSYYEFCKISLSQYSQSINQGASFQSNCSQSTDFYSFLNLYECTINKQDLFGNITSCLTTLQDGSIKNETYYINTLTKFSNIQATDSVDVMQNVQNIQGFLQSEYLFSYNKTYAELQSPFVCTGSLKDMVQTCSNDNQATQIVYTCQYSNISFQGLLCQQNNEKSSSTTKDESKFFNTQNGLQYVYEQNKKITVRYCSFDNATLNQNCLYLYSYYQAQFDPLYRISVNITIENTGQTNLLIYYTDYFGVDYLSKNLSKGQSFLQQAFQGDRLIVANALTNQTILIIRARNYNEYFKLSPISSSSNSQAISILFTNTMNISVSISYINSYYVEIPYQVLNPGQSYTQQTYYGSEWSIRDNQTNNEIFKFIGSQVRQQINISLPQNLTALVQSRQFFKQNYQLQCNGSIYAESIKQNCSDNQVQTLSFYNYTCQSVNQSILCAGSIIQNGRQIIFQKLSLLQSNLTYLSSNHTPDTIIVMKCINIVENGHFNQSCNYLYTLFNVKKQIRNQFFKLNSNRTIDQGILSSQTEGYQLIVQQIISGENTYFLYNNKSQLVHSCSENSNKLIYCTSDKTGVDFNEIKCYYNQIYDFLSCENIGQKNCSAKSNQSSCKYSIFYLQQFDRQDNSTSNISNNLAPTLQIDQYYQLQNFVFYDQNNMLIGITDDPYGDVCLSVDSKFCLNSNYTGLLKNASYCFSYDKYSCYSNSGPYCNYQLPDKTCARINGVDLTNLTYCVSQDNKKCYQDQGQLCASQNLVNCNISRYQNICETNDGINCFNQSNGYSKGWYYTQDGANVYQSSTPNSKIGSYCYSNNGQKCSQIFLNLINQDVGLCLSDKNQNCIQDTGTVCNSTDQQSCNIYNNTQSCKTLDMRSCIKGFWIKTSSTADQSGTTSFCYSSDGINCKKQLGGPYCFNGNNISPYLCHYQKLNSEQTLKTISICLSNDGQNCYNDLETTCKQTSESQFCAFNTTDNFCLTQDNLKCSLIGPGWYFTKDGQRISQIFSSLLKQQGTYCYSLNGVNCSQSNGPYCNLQDGSNCANLDRINPIQSTQCLSYDNKTCFKDDGALCKPSGNTYDGSCGFQNPNYCLNNDFGNQCLDLISGWYYTQDNYNIYASNEPNGIVGAYCYSNNGLNCLVNYDPLCNFINDKSRCLNTTQCVSIGNQKCYKDFGSMCNQTSGLNKLCYLNKNSQKCSTKLQDGNDCYYPNVNLQNQVFQKQLDVLNNNGNLEVDYLFCYSNDGVQCYTVNPLIGNFQNFSQIQGIYCQTKNGFTCFQNYGPNCIPNSGYYCTTNDGINPALVSYCATSDNKSCVKDQGLFCNSNLNTFCNISYSQNACFTLDYVSCFQFTNRWYFTLDQINVYQQKTIFRQVGSYCYSYDGIYCKQNWLNFTSQNISYCISQNNQTCYQDIGSICNNTFSDNYCFIQNQTNNCETVDGITCSNFNYIRRKNMNSLCYSYDGINCLTTNGGIYCKNNTDYLCASKNQLLQQLSICLSYDGKNCYNCTLSNYKQCYTTGDNVNYCHTLNGYNCNLLSTGYYFTYNGIHVAPLQLQVYNPALVGVKGYFCLSDDSYRCARNYGPLCDPRTLSQCTLDQEQRFLFSVQCITNNNINCYQDSGLICASTKSKNPSGTCALQITQSWCASTDNGNTCYVFTAGYYYTQNVISLYTNKQSNGLNGSYCYSETGNSCKQNYGFGCNFTSGYNCTTHDEINPKKVSYCATKDSINCLSDLGQFCNQTSDLTSCNIFNNTKNCETLDIITCYKKEKGWYNTFDNINVVSAQKNPGYPRIYCYSDDGLKCKKNYGVSCNQSTGYLCTTTDGISPIVSFYCVSLDNNTCYQDYGQLCNFTGTQVWCNLLISTNNCTTYDGLTCYKFSPGWYFSLNYNSILPSTQALETFQGAYCYSNDGYNCYKDFGVNCDPRTGYMCATSDGINPQFINYCVTDNYLNCKIDNGTFCNFTGTQNWCNIYSYYPSCVTMYGNNKCYNILGRWYLTYDGIHVNTLPAGLRGYLATYCYSYDGTSCYQDFGPKCNLITGNSCSTSNGADLTLGTYCISANNQTCYQDIGSLCNNTNMLNWCNIVNSTNNCFSQDGQKCNNFLAQYCLTFDGIRCTTLQISNQKGTYCWSNNGQNCSSQGVPNCDPSKGQICSASNVSFCITRNNQTCLQDMGYFCNNTYDYTSCNINWNTSTFCVTKDSYNCLNQSQTLKNETKDQIQRRSMRDYFFYAINENINKIRNVTTVGVCDPKCQSYKNSCCVGILRDDKTVLTSFDNICMQKYVAQNSFNFDINGISYQLNCIQQYP